jgi:uncharacterized protein YccT (UPF0319 family)
MPFDDIPLDHLCFARFRQEPQEKGVVVTTLSVPRVVNEAVQSEAMQYLFDHALPGARTQFRQWLEAETEEA